MKNAPPSKARRGSRGFLCALAILLVGSCSSPTPQGCAAPPPLLAAKINSVLSPFLDSLIRYSRDGALREGAQPLPADLRKALQPYFEEDTLERARWTIASRRLGLGTVITSTLPRYEALTLEDTIVFRDAAATNRLDVWIHELTHVEQYAKAGGARNFSRPYLASWDEIELETVGQTNRILGQLKQTERQRAPTLRRACTVPAALPGPAATA